MILEAVGLCGLILGPGPPVETFVRGQESAAAAAVAGEQASGDAAERLQAILDEYDSAYAAFLEAYRAAEDDEARQVAMEERYPDPADYLGRVLEIARAEESGDTGFRALEWAARQSNGSEQAAEVLGLLRRHHVNRPDLSSLVSMMGYRIEPSVGAFLEAVLAENEAVDVRAHACFALGRFLGNRVELAERIAAASGEARDLVVASFGAETVAGLADLDDEGLAALRARSLACFERLVSDEALGAVDTGRGTLAEAAAGHLFEAQNLAVGQVAPDIEGVDADEVAFRLSDYRGQVVLLDFWGDW